MLLVLLWRTKRHQLNAILLYPAALAQLSVGLVDGGALAVNVGRQLLAGINGALQQPALARRQRLQPLLLVGPDLLLQPLLLLLNLLQAQAKGVGERAGYRDASL